VYSYLYCWLPSNKMPPMLQGPLLPQPMRKRFQPGACAARFISAFSYAHVTNWIPFLKVLSLKPFTWLMICFHCWLFRVEIFKTKSHIDIFRQHFSSLVINRLPSLIIIQLKMDSPLHIINNLVSDYIGGITVFRKKSSYYFQSPN
jgi:hypothetical protein